MFGLKGQSLIGTKQSLKCINVLWPMNKLGNFKDMILVILLDHYLFV